MKPLNLMLRSERSERLEAWEPTSCLRPTLRDGAPRLLRVRQEGKGATNEAR